MNGPSIPIVATQLALVLPPPLAAELVLLLLLLLLLPQPAAISAVSANPAVIIRPFTDSTSSSGDPAESGSDCVDSGGAAG